jgi:hypothetical protein
MNIYPLKNRKPLTIDAVNNFVKEGHRSKLDPGKFEYNSYFPQNTPDKLHNLFSIYRIEIYDETQEVNKKFFRIIVSLTAKIPTLKAYLRRKFETLPTHIIDTWTTPPYYDIYSGNVESIDFIIDLAQTLISYEPEMQRFYNPQSASEIYSITSQPTGIRSRNLDAESTEQLIRPIQDRHEERSRNRKWCWGFCGGKKKSKRKRILKRRKSKKN